MADLDKDTPEKKDEDQKPQDSATPETTPGSDILDEPEDSLEAKPDKTGIADEKAQPDSNKKKKSKVKQLRQRVNIYLFLLVAIIIMAASIILIAYKQSQSSKTTSGAKTQTLDQATLNKLAQTNSTVGSGQYVLKVESSAIFDAPVILRQNVEAAGNLQVGGTATFNNIAVAGTGQFSQATISSNLAVGGNSAVQGSATIGKSLQVSGGGSFGGALTAPQITTSTLQLNGNLVLQHHVSVSGPVPNRSSGSALGGGGSVSISGTDTAGSISINTGSGAAAGCFVTVTFTSAYDTIPHVLVTPIGSSAGAFNYYVNRSTTSFSVCAATKPPDGSSFGFDYFIVD